MIEDATNPIPPWVSIWTARYGRQPGQKCEPTRHESIDLYEFTIAQRSYMPSVNRLYIAGRSDLFLVDVVFHPGCVVVHPFDRHPTTAKLYPNPPETFESHALRILTDEEFADWKTSWGWPHYVMLSESFDPLCTPWTVSNADGWNGLPPGANGGASPIEDL
jgi:hypothetical protein